MAADDNSLLDRLILQARLANEEDNPTPGDPAHSATADYPAEWRLDPSTAGP